MKVLFDRLGLFIFSLFFLLFQNLVLVNKAPSIPQQPPSSPIIDIKAYLTLPYHRVNN